MPERDVQSGAASWLVPVAGAAAVLLIVAVESPRALLFLVTDGVVALGIVATASLAGLWLVSWLCLGELPLRWHLLLGAGLGIGVLALSALVLGLAGLLSRTLWCTLLAAAGISGIVKLGMLCRHPTSKSDTPSPRRVWYWLWLVACPFAALTLLVAMVPPGVLWVEEGGGYDALEYHLQMPREHFEAGRIEYAEHNVYANFPANAEMLYLLAMVVEGGPLAGVTAAKLINAWMAFLTVGAAWLAGREAGPTTGLCTGLLAATAGWLFYLSGVAYAENTMLFFAMLSAAAMVRASKAEGGTELRWIIIAGLLAGFSAGCKYTALVLIVMPLGLAILVGRWSSQPRRVTAFVLFSLAGVVSFAPWMLKNLAFTGNPVFPLAGSVFDSFPAGWSAELAEHFARSHAPSPDESALSVRAGAMWSKVIADRSQRFGPAVFLLAVVGLVANRRRRLVLQFGLVLLVQMVLWMGLTHLYARFAVVLLVPLVILGGRFMGELSTPVQKMGLVVLLGGGLWNLNFAVDIYRQHLYAAGRRICIEGAPELFTNGQVPFTEHLGVINHELPEGSKVLLIGEARAFYFLGDVDYCVVFNRSPFVEAVEAADDLSAVGAWLTAKGYTHVYVCQSEIERLRRSRYGFPAVVTRELFDRLISAGLLQPVRVFSTGTGSPPYGVLYEVSVGRIRRPDIPR